MGSLAQSQDMPPPFLKAARTQMITVQQVEKYLKLHRKQITVLSMCSSKTVIAKQIQNDQPTDVLIQTIPQIFNLKELAQYFVTKPLQIDGEQLYFKTIDDNQLLLANDFNRRISRACISLWEDKQLMVLTAVTKDLRNNNYCAVCASLLQTLQKEAQTKEETVMFHGAKIAFIKKINKRKLSQHTCIVLLNYNQDAGDDPYNQPSVQLVKAIHATCQAYKDLLYTAYAFNNTTTQIVDDLATTFFYLDKINILDNANDALENSFPEPGKLCEIYIFNPGEEQVQQISIGEVSELKKLQIDLHQRLVNMNFIKLTSPEMNYLDLTEDKRLSVDGFAFPYVQRMYKYNRQPVLIVKEQDPVIVEQYQKLCKQFNTYLILQGNGNPEDYKNVTMVHELPYVIKASKFIYADGPKPRFLSNFQQFIPLAQGYQQTVQSLQDETQDELEVDEAQLPEFRFSVDENNNTLGVVFRGYNFPFIQQPAPYKEKQFPALIFIDSSQPDFEFQLERAYLLQNKCPEVYMAFVIRGITNDLYLRQKMTRTTLLTKLNILQYKSGFIKALRKFEPRLQHMIYFYDSQMRFYGRQFSLIEALEQYKDILEDLTNQTIYSERRTAKQFFYNTPAINQYVFQGQILKSVNVAKPYLKQALIALFFIAPNRHPKTGQVCEQDLIYDLNQALDCQKSGFCFVLVCVEGVSIANISSYMEKYPVLKQLNVLGDKDVISKIKFVNRVTNNEGRNYYIIDQIANKIMRYSSSAMICSQLEHEENNNNFLHDDTNSVENVIYNDLVFTYVQRVKQRHQQQGLCLVYLDPVDPDKLAMNVQRVCALQDKYPEVSFDISIIGVDENGFKRENFESIYYFDRLNVVGDAADTHSIVMNRADFSYYLYNNNFEFLKKNVGQAQLDADLMAYVGATEPRISFFDDEISENDKALIIQGYYMPYLRRVQHKNPIKTLLIFILDQSDDRYAGYLKQIDTVRKNYPELYVVALINDLNRETYVNVLEAFPVLNKYNIISADNGVAEKYLSQHPGKPLLALMQGEVYDDFLKLMQVVEERFSDKEVTTPQEIIFKGQKCQYLQQVFERHRKQAVLLCCIPKDEQVESRVQQIYQLQTIYPEVYFVYYIEQTDIVSIQAYKRTVFKFPHINIIKNVIMEGKGLQFYLLNSKFEQKQRMKTLSHLKQELRKLQFDLNQCRECIVPCIDCQQEDRINYYGRTLEYYRKNYKNEDQNVGIIFAVLDPDAPTFAADCEALNNLRKQALKYAYVLVSLRGCAFERARDVINADVNLMEMNVVAAVPEYLEQGTPTQRFELHSHMLIQRSDVRLFDTVEALQAEIVKDGFIQHDDVSDAECALDPERPGDVFYADHSKPDSVIFRGTELHVIQTADLFRQGDSVIFTYIDDIADIYAVEQRLKVQYEMMHAYPGHYALICIRGITNTTQLSKLDRAHYLREVTILAYKSGLSRMFSQAEKEQKMCTFYFQPKVEAVENRRVTRFVPARLETLANLEKAKYVASIIPETPSENQMVVNGVRHNYVQRITEYNVKYRYILTIYCMPDQYNHVHQYLADMVQTRDDVYVAVVVAGVNDIPQLTQIAGTNKELNVLDDGSGCCERVFAWYAQEYRTFYERTMSEYKRQMERYERLREIRAEIENEDEKQDFTDKYNVMEPRDPKLSKSVNLLVLFQDASYPQNCQVQFQIPSVISFTENFGMSQKQLELEKDKIAGSSIKLETIEFDLIQKQNCDTSEVKHNIIIFLNTQHPNFSLEVSNLYQMDQQTPKVLLAVCLIGVSKLTQEHFSLAHNLQNLNIVADRPMKFAKDHMTYYVMLPNGELVTNLGSAPIAQLQFFSKVTQQPIRYDIKGDKQVLFNGAIYQYLRRILFKSTSGAAVFAFIKSDNEMFEAFAKQLHDAQLKFPEVAMVLFIQDVQRADLKELLQKFPQLYNVNIAEDKNLLVQNMLSRSSTGITIVGWNGKDKEVQLDDTAKLDATVVSFGYKAVSVKAEDKVVLKTKQDQSVTFTFIQKIYQRRGTSPNALVNQRVCLCLIPPEDKYYNDRMVYYTYTMQVRFPEIYFIIGFPGMAKEDVLQLQEKFAYLSEMNIVDSPQAATLLHECNRNDVDNEGLPEESLGQKIFTYRLFDGLCKEDTDVSGTPQDEIFAEFVVDKYSTREHLKYLAPAIQISRDKLIYKGYNMALINKSNLSKYAPEKPIVFVKLVQNEKIDLVCKQFVEIMRQKPEVYFVFSIERVGKDQLKAFMQTHPQIKLLNIVYCAAHDNLYPTTADIGQNKSVAIDFNLVMQLPSFDFYDNFYAQLYGAEQLPVSSKVQILASFIEKIQSEFQMNQDFQQNAANLDIEPPARPAQKEGEEEPVDEAKYEYYDQLVVGENVVYFRYYELPFLQKGPEFAEFRQKQKYCLVTAARQSPYEANFFEKTIREIYLQSQEHTDIGYMVVIENLYDTANLFKLSQQAYYLNKLVVLAYKFGFNQLLRAPGEFVCDRIIMREMIFNRVNCFYYERKDAASDEKTSIYAKIAAGFGAASTEQSSSTGDYVVCRTLSHAVNRDFALVEQNDATKLLLDTPNSNYLVLYGAAYRVLRRPDQQFATIQNKKKSLFVFIVEENPAILDMVTDAARKLKCAIFVIANGVTAENVNGFSKKHKLCQLATVLSDEGKTVTRVAKYAKKLHGIDNQVILLKINAENEAETAAAWSDKFDDIDMAVTFKQEPTEPDGWWNAGNDDTTLA